MDFISSATEAIRQTFSPTAKEKLDERAAELRATLGDGLCVGVLGDASRHAEAVAQRAALEAVWLTLGQESAQGLANSCHGEVYHLIASWDRSGLPGTDLAVCADAPECAALMAELGDIFLAFPGAESDAADVLTAARERGAAVIPVAANASSARPWFVNEEQWACLRDSDSPESKVAAACAAALTSYDVHRKA
ncbi:unnamed protein product, partial [Effrenium voratum]